MKQKNQKRASKVKAKKVKQPPATERTIVLHDPPEVLSTYPWLEHEKISDLATFANIAATAFWIGLEHFDEDELRTIGSGLGTALGALSEEVDEYVSNHRENEVKHYKLMEEMLTQRATKGGGGS